MTITTNPSREALLAQRLEINSQLRKERHKLSLPNATATDEDVRRIDDLLGQRDKVELQLEQRSAVSLPGHSGAADRHPLAYTATALDALQESITSRTGGRFAANMEERAALQTGTFGAPRMWGANVLDGPRLLHVAAGVPQQREDAVFAQLPTLTLPTASASVGETVTLGEFAASTAGSVTLARFGRWTDLSREALIGTSAETIVAAHVIGCALDLDNALVSLVNTAAGSAVAFSSDVPAAIRKSIATVTAATAAADAGRITILSHPDNIALLESVTPIGGQTIGEGFSKFSGALVYPSTAVPTGFMLVGNLAAGVRYFEAQGVTTETDVSIKTGVYTAATSVIAGYGNALAGYCQKIDVLTP